MHNFFQNLKFFLKKELSILWIFGVALGLVLIALQIKQKLPLGTGDFVFISILAMCVALYRPRWAFYLFVSVIPLENIIIASGFLPIQLRPYQYVGAILAAAIIILSILKHLPFKLLKPNWFDWLVLSLVPLSFLSSIYSPFRSISLKNSIILLSFMVLYFLVRNFIRTRRHLIESVFFFLASNIVVLIFGFYQVFADKFNARSFEVMFGRPNATFTEADWLGIFLCFALATLFSVKSFGILPRQLKALLYFLIFLNLTLLILSLSRSAWIGAVVVTLFWLIFSLFKKGEQGATFTPKIFASHFLTIFFVTAISLAAIHFAKLSKFDIFDRARSAATNEQKITITCESSQNIPQTISNTNELEKFGCQHIELEEIGDFKSRGKFVTEIFRQDPNILTRGAIYQKSFAILRENPALGVGFGTITQTLGADERGAGLNESNIFLQIWAGVGILGLIAFSVAIIYLFVYAFRRLSPICPLNKIIGCPIVRDEFERSTNVFVFLGLVALIVPNLFNAGLLMALFWLGLGISISCIYVKQ